MDIHIPVGVAVAIFSPIATAMAVAIAVLFRAYVKKDKQIFELLTILREMKAILEVLARR